MPERHHLLIREMFRLSLRTFRVKPVRSILTILGMSVGFGVVLFLVSLGYGLQYILVGNLATTQDSLVTMMASYPTESNLSFYAKDISVLASLPSVTEVVPVTQFSGEAVKSGTNQPALVLFDVVDPAYFRLMGSKVSFGRIISTTTPGVVVTSQTLALLGISTSTQSLGTKLDLVISYEDALHGTSTQARSRESLPIVGVILDDSQAASVFVSPNDVTAPPPFYQTALVKASNVNTVESVRNQLINKGLLVSARIDLVNQARQITNLITIVLGVFGITALVVSAIGMFNTMIVSFMERTYEVGVLKSLGATDVDVQNLFLLESAFMGFLGGSGGVLMGYLAGQMINFGIVLLAQHFGSKAFTLFITPLWFIGLTVGLSILIGLISGFWPARRAAALSAKEAFLQR